MKSLYIYLCCLLLVTSLSSSFIDDAYSKAGLTITSPVNGSLCGSVVEISFRFEFFGNNNLRINPSHAKYLLDVFENGLKKVDAMPLSKWDVYYHTDSYGLLSLDCIVTILSNRSDGTVVSHIVNQTVDVYAIPHSYDLLNGVRTVENKVLFDAVSSLISVYFRTATSVSITIDRRSVVFESMMRLSPLALEIFDWSSLGSKACLLPPHIKFATKHSKWHNVHCDPQPIPYRAFYDVSVIDVTSLDGMTTEAISTLAKHVHTMCQKTLGYLILITSDSILETLASFSPEILEASCLLDPIQKIPFMGSNGFMLKVLVVIFPVDNRLRHSTVSSPEQLMRSEWRLVEHQKLSYLVVSNGCVQEDGELVLLQSPEDYGVKPLMVEDSRLYDVLNNYLFIPFGNFLVGSVKDVSEVQYVNASAALMRPYFEFHVAHFFQSIGGLLTMKEALHSDPLSYLLLPKFDSHAGSMYDWPTGMLSLVTQSYEEQHSAVTNDKLSALFAPQFYSLFNPDSGQGPKLVCFKELIVVGQASSFTGLFANSSVASDFRERAYQTLREAEEVTEVQTEQPPDGGHFFGLSTHKTNQYKLKVTFVLRWYNRRIINLPALHRVLMDSGVVDVDWLNSPINSRWRYPEQMSLRDQIQLFKETDLLIGVHGGAFVNAALFLQPNSVVIEIMPSRFSEPFFHQMVYQAGVKIYTMFVTNHNQSSHCPSFAPECLDEGLKEGSALKCVGLRNCDVTVDVAWFQALVELSAHYIRANKRTEEWSITL